LARAVQALSLVAAAVGGAGEVKRARGDENGACSSFEEAASLAAEAGDVVAIERFAVARRATTGCDASQRC
ncbi:MAG: hypothetical protein H5U40_11255, partial [Polyangiaceae bacterium]|nr:hypothetical protein [Polyangiaceae bacterium]